MSDKKNFSVLGRIDEKYVEEADGYVVSARREKGGGRVETSAEKRRKNRRRAKRLVQAAACVAVVCAACFFGVTAFIEKNNRLEASTSPELENDPAQASEGATKNSGDYGFGAASGAESGFFPEGEGGAAAGDSDKAEDTAASDSDSSESS